MNIWNSIYTLLTRPSVYRAFQRAVMGDARRIYLDEYVKPVAGERLLDIGCGPGDILEALPDVTYVGFDHNEDYIEAARQRFGSRGRFFSGDVGEAVLEDGGEGFDVVLATGVLHHLDDERASRLFSLASQSLRLGGRLVTYDGCFAPDQSWLARWVVSHDRGRFVRPVDAYLNLARPYFARVEPEVRYDLLRIPYTHLILRCFK